jgi:putative membrane protein insertion efficiency factor
MMARGLMLLVRGYQVTFGSVMPPVCRFQPTCSNYAMEALERHGAFKGTWLAVWRLCRCNPWGGMGYDPVPD